MNHSASTRDEYNNGSDFGIILTVHFNYYLMERNIRELAKGGLPHGKLLEPSLNDVFQGFIHAIRWTEPFIISIFFFHLTFIILIMATWGHVHLRMTLFAIISAFIFCAEYVNSYLGDHWKEYEITQNYFDKKGIFVSIFYSAPLVIMIIFMLIGILVELFRAMVIVKQIQLKQGTVAKNKLKTSAENSSSDKKHD